MHKQLVLINLHNTINIFRIPKDPKLEELWLNAIAKWIGKFPKQKSVFVCSSHFEPGLVLTKDEIGFKFLQFVSKQ